MHLLFVSFFDLMEHVLDLESLKKLTPEQQKTLISGVKQQAAILNAQNMITVSSLSPYVIDILRIAWFILLVLVPKLS